MPGRLYNSANYRYGFNGKENDNEIKGVGNSLDFGGRIYDNRLSRWLSIDPLTNKYTDLSPFGFVANSPILHFDPDGERIVDANGNIAVELDKSGNVSFTKYATPAIKKVVSAMLITPIGKKIIKDMVTDKQDIRIKIDKRTVYKNPKTGERSFDKKEGFTNFVLGDTDSKKDGKGDLKSSDITIYEGSLNEVRKKGDFEGYTLNEVYGATGVHEGTHATDRGSNRKTATPGINLEEKPIENSKQFRKEIDEIKESKIKK